MNVVCGDKPNNPIPNIHVTPRKPPLCGLAKKNTKTSHLDLSDESIGSVPYTVRSGIDTILEINSISNDAEMEETLNDWAKYLERSITGNISINPKYAVMDDIPVSLRAGTKKSDITMPLSVAYDV